MMPATTNAVQTTTWALAEQIGVDVVDPETLNEWLRQVRMSKRGKRSKTSAQLAVNERFGKSIDPRIIIEGKGMRVWDQNGKEYIDAVSGAVWTVNVGYGRERIANAVHTDGGL